MLNGKLSIEVLDNGWLLSWFEGINAHREGYCVARDFYRRIEQLTGALNPQVESAPVNSRVDHLPNVNMLAPSGAIDLGDNLPPACSGGVCTDD